MSIPQAAAAMGLPSNGGAAAAAGGGQQPAKQEGPQQQPPKKPRTLLEEALVKPCEGCRKQKNRCTGGIPCVRCFDRLLRCEKRPLAALVPYPALVFASTDFAVRCVE